MKLFIAAVAIIASFSVCANEAYGTYEDNPSKLFDASSVRHDTVTITWKRVDNNMVDKTCKLEGNKRGLTFTVSSEACSFWDGLECIIITGKNATMHELGHETRHCFQGNWH